MGLLSLFGHNDEKAEVLCPYCEKSLADGHNQDKCAQRGMSRRSFFFMGIMEQFIITGTILSPIMVIILPSIT